MRPHPLLVAPLAAAILAALPTIARASDPPTVDGDTVLPKVVVEGTRANIAPARAVDDASLEARAAATSDAASLLEGQPGVWINAAGGVSGLPSIRGLADDRLRIRLDGADITASCPNHMNPALSYVAPSDVARIVVYPGITPVSQGGDSIGGSIVVERSQPSFAAAGEGIVLSGELGTYYRSNGDAHGANASLTIASEHLSVRYTGATARAGNYRAGGEFKDYDFTGREGHTLDRDEVGSTGYVSHNQSLQLAYTNGDHLLEARLGWQQIPRQDYPNQRMDLTDNRQRSTNLRYLGQFGWGRLEARAYRETLDHAMDFGPDKRFWYGAASGGNNPPGGQATPCAPIGPTCAAGMPMLTSSDTTAFMLDADITLQGEDRLRLGLEQRAYRLDDWWPPSGGMMSPGEFWNIRDGERDRTAAYAEWEHHLGPRWTAELGVRYERVRMDAGPVQGYNPASNMMGSWQMRDAALFNAADRARSDGNWDATAILRQSVSDRMDIAYGLARKVRSPGLYEVFPWSTWTMAAVMNNFVGDGNGYVGNLALAPERALTASVTIDLHAADRRWELQATPYVTSIADYIDAIQWNPDTNAARSVPVRNAFTVLKYVNQDARLHGLDLSGKARLAETGLGVFALQGTLSWVHGENRTTGDGLYNRMPANARLSLTQRLGGWDNALELVAVARKDDVSQVRNELETAGYGLLHLRFSRAWSALRVDFGVENLFDRHYALPTGGAYLGQGTTMSINPPVPNYPRWGTQVPGPGRSLYAAVTLAF
jgi:iron complex outermembrane receptor protein